MDFTLHTLGCGSAKPSGKHNPSCTVLDIRGSLYMIDCGEGAQQMFQRQRLKFTRLRHIFLTHLHGDHWLGLPGLLSTLSLTKCTGSVMVHTFQEGADMLRSIMNTINREQSYELEYDIIEPTDAMIYENDFLSIRSVELNHRVPTVGYVFEEKPRKRHIIKSMTDFHGVPYSAMERIRNGADFVRKDGTVIKNEMLTSAATPSVSYAHISDTAYMPNLAEKIGSVDLLLHESTYLEEHVADAHARFHSTAREAAMVAKECNAKKLLLSHFSSRYKDEEAFVREGSEVFNNCILNREGLTLKL